jgi:F0F1-type ATP synthase assembly protein I
MGESPQQTKTKTTTQAVLLLGTSALDTTWRVLVPGIVGTVLGLILDHAWHTTPFVMIVGLVLGIALSVVLVIKQFKALNK